MNLKNDNYYNDVVVVVVPTDIKDDDNLTCTLGKSSRYDSVDLTCHNEPETRDVTSLVSPERREVLVSPLHLGDPLRRETLWRLEPQGRPSSTRLVPNPQRDADLGPGTRTTRGH